MQDLLADVYLPSAGSFVEVFKGLGTNFIKGWDGCTAQFNKVLNFYLKNMSAHPVSNA